MFHILMTSSELANKCTPDISHITTMMFSYLISKVLLSKYACAIKFDDEFGFHIYYKKVVILYHVIITTAGYFKSVTKYIKTPHAVKVNDHTCIK